MDDVEKAIFENRLWALETLQQLGMFQTKQPRVGGEGTAKLNREIISRLEEILVVLCQKIGVEPPEELTALIAWQLNIGGRVRNESRLKIEQMAAAAALARHPNASKKKLARLCGVSRPTIALWMKQPGFTNLIAMFEVEPILREVFRWEQ